MKNADNENEPNSWRSIGWQAALIVNKLRCQAQLTNLDKEQDEQRSGQTDAGRRDQKESGQNSADIEKRLRELAAMEKALKRITLIPRA